MSGELISAAAVVIVALMGLAYMVAEASNLAAALGTLDEPDRLPPDIHIFTASKQPWVLLPPDTPAVPEYYDRRQVWPAESLARGKAHIARFPRR